MPPQSRRVRSRLSLSLWPSTRPVPLLSGRLRPPLWASFQPVVRWPAAMVKYTSAAARTSGRIAEDTSDNGTWAAGMDVGMALEEVGVVGRTDGMADP